MPWARHIARLRRNPARGWGSSAGLEQFLADIFHEVDEEVRREQLKKLWDRYSIYLIARAVLIVARDRGWRGYEYWDAKRPPPPAPPSRPPSSLSEQGKYAEAEAAFAKVATDAPAGYRILARMRGAAELAQVKPAEAVKAYDEISPHVGSLGATLHDLAAVRAGHAAGGYTLVCGHAQTA